MQRSGLQAMLMASLMLASIVLWPSFVASQVRALSLVDISLAMTLSGEQVNQELITAPVGRVVVAIQADAITREEQKAPQELDLETLEQRLRETRAIGFFTKLALRNQIDDLLNRFRAYHRGRPNISLEQLREDYNLLLLKVQSLLQDDDPKLAQDIMASREALWRLLTDPEQFAEL